MICCFQLRGTTHLDLQTLSKPLFASDKEDALISLNQLDNDECILFVGICTTSTVEQ